MVTLCIWRLFHKLMSSMPVSQTEMALSRRHVPSYLHHLLHDLINLLLTQRGRWGQMMAWMSHLHLMRLTSSQILFSFQLRNRQRSSSLLLSMLFDTVYHHYTSYKMNVSLLWSSNGKSCRRATCSYILSADWLFARAIWRNNQQSTGGTWHHCLCSNLEHIIQAACIFCC